MTNLTDEGLRTIAYETIRNCKGSQDMFPKLLKTLQQVRDAAKKEEREAAAKVAEGFQFLSDCNCDRNERIATAIRQWMVGSEV